MQRLFHRIINIDDWLKRKRDRQDGKEKCRPKGDISQSENQT